MTEDTVKWPILRDISTRSNIITISPASYMGKTIKKKLFWVVHHDDIQRIKTTRLCTHPPTENRAEYSVPLSPSAPTAFVKLKEMGSVTGKKKKGSYAIFLWHLPRAPSQRL